MTTTVAPAIAALTLFAFVYHWNSYLWPLTVLQGAQVRRDRLRDPERAAAHVEQAGMASLRVRLPKLHPLRCHRVDSPRRRALVLDPFQFFEEMDGLIQRGLDAEERVNVSLRAHLLLPHHKLEESFADQVLGEIAARRLGKVHPCSR